MSAFELSGDERLELAPDGKLYVAVAVGPAASAVWCTRDPETNRPVGVTVSLAKAISDRTGLPIELVEFASSGDIVAKVGEGGWTLSFVPIDEDRKRLLGVGPDYYRGVSTFLTRSDEFATADDVDRAGVRVAGISGTATLRSAERWVKKASTTGIASLQEAVDLFKAGEVDALAIGKESILSLIDDLPGCHAVAGHFHEAGTAIVVPKNNAAGLVAVSRFMAALKADGTVRSVFDANGMSHAEVAP